MTANTHTAESVLGTLKTAIKAQGVVYDLAWRGIGGGALIEVAKPMIWLGHLEHDERANFFNWLWAVAKPTEEGEERERSSPPSPLTTCVGSPLRSTHPNPICRNHAAQLERKPTMTIEPRRQDTSRMTGEGRSAVEPMPRPTPAPTQVVAQSPIRAPLAGGIPWANHSDHPAVAGFAFTTDAQIQTVAAAVVDRTGGKLDRR
jgi:hypothetical protein